MLNKLGILFNPDIDFAGNASTTLDDSAGRMQMSSPPQVDQDAPPISDPIPPASASSKDHIAELTGLKFKLRLLPVIDLPPPLDNHTVNQDDGSASSSSHALPPKKSTPPTVDSNLHAPQSIIPRLENNLPAASGSGARSFPPETPPYEDLPSPGPCGDGSGYDPTGDVDDDDGATFMTGPLSDIEKAEIDERAKEFHEWIKDCAIRFKRHALTLLRMCGIGEKETRAIQPWNVFQVQWYLENPRSTGKCRACIARDRATYMLSRRQKQCQNGEPDARMPTTQC